MNDRSTFEGRLAQALQRYADEAPGQFDAAAIASTATRLDRRRSRIWVSGPTLLPLFMGFLLALLLAGAAVVGARLFFNRQLSVVPVIATASLIPTPGLAVATATATPIATATATATATARPTATITPPPTSGPTASPVATSTPGTGFSGPCAPMLQLLTTYITDPIAPLATGSPVISLGLDDVLITTNVDGLGRIGRYDASSGALVPITPGEEQRAFASSVPVPGQARFTASPNGRALAVEEGDFGAAGCGDPLVLLNEGGRTRPFPVGAFQLVRNVAWASDGSALYAVRRPTINGDGQPFRDQDSGAVLDGPGTLLRWDTGTTKVTELGSPCSGCPLGDLYVSPDGKYVATETGDGHVAIVDAKGAWQTLVEGGGLVGWADATHLALNDSTNGLTGLDGSTRPWNPPCCHGTGFGGPLSPDGSTIAGMTLNADFLNYSVTLLNVTDGSSRNILTVPDVRGCTAFEQGSSGYEECVAAHPETPGPDAISDYARVEAWSPSGDAVLVLDQQADSTAGAVRIVKADGSGSGPITSVNLLDLSFSLGFPNVGPEVVWLPGAR